MINDRLESKVQINNNKLNDFHKNIVFVQVLNWSHSESLPEIAKTAHCGTCGHPGTLGNHRKSGCGLCGTQEHYFIAFLSFFE